MSTNESEAYLEAISRKTFLNLWTIPNPHRSAGREITDLLVVFGEDLIVLSDKACEFDSTDLSLSWKRWYQRTVSESIKQLGGAAGKLGNSQTPVFIDRQAKEVLPFERPKPGAHRLHLVGIARPGHDPKAVPPGWKGLTYDSSIEADEEPLCIGLTKVKGQFVHIFDAQSIELLLHHLDTATDFLSYLKAREHVLTSPSHRIVFRECDLLAMATNSWSMGHGFTIELPDPGEDGVTRVPTGLWDAYISSDRAKRTHEANKASRVIDNLIDHFHGEYVDGNLYLSNNPDYAAHEQALRIIASESRLGRRIIAAPLYDIINEPTDTCWAITVASAEAKNVRYVWLMYPYEGTEGELEDYEKAIKNYLQAHLIVARDTFSQDIIVGVAMPNPDAKCTSILIMLLDGTNWSEHMKERAKVYRSNGVFATLTQFDIQHRP